MSKELYSQLNEISDTRLQSDLISLIFQSLIRTNAKEFQNYSDHFLALSKKNKSSNYKAWSVFFKAKSTKYKGNSVETLDEFNTALKLFTQLKNGKGIACSYNEIAIIQRDLGKNESAIINHSESLKVGLENNDKRDIATAYYGLGKVYLRIGDYSKALEHLLAAQKICKEIEFAVGLLESYINLGVIYEMEGSYSKAFSNYIQLLKMYEALGNKIGIASALTRIGNVFQDQGNLKEALVYHIKALKIKEEIDDKRGLVESYSSIGNIYKEENKHSKALSYFFKCQSTSEEIRFEYGIAGAYFGIGSVYLSQKKHSDSISSYKKGLAISEQIGFQIGVAISNINLAKGFMALKDFDEAANHLEIGLKTAQQIGYKKDISYALQVWYELKKAIGENLDALNYFEQYVALEREIKNEETAKKITEIKLGYDVELKEKETAFYKQRGVELEEINKQIEKEKKEAEYQRTRAEESERFKQLFLANMSHEIRTPMNAIVGITNLLLGLPQDQKNLQYLSAIKYSCDSLLVVINDVLDLSKIEAGKLFIQQIPFSIQTQTEMLQALFEEKALEKKINFKIEIQPGIPSALLGDPYRLNQVLINLVGNAFKFTNKGTIYLKISKESTNAYRFTIKDTGVGIASQKLKTIFENFQQATTSLIQQYEGTGLGLSISKQLVKLMGGSIEVKSKLGKGSEFTFVLPLKKTASASLPIAPLSNLSERSAALNGIRILLAEDNKYNQIVTVDTLRQQIKNPVITIAKTGKEVLRKLSQNDYDIILMDINMPQMNGYEATQKIRETFQGSKRTIPIVALTASAILVDAASPIAAGMNGYLTKPITAEKLVAEIHKHLIKAKTTKITSAKKATQAKGMTRVDKSYLQNFTKGNVKRMLKYIDLFLKTTPLQIQNMKEAKETSNNKLLSQTLHTLTPQLKFMGMQKAMDTAFQLEKKTASKNKMNASTKDLIVQLEKEIKASIVDWKKIQSKLN